MASIADLQVAIQLVGEDNASGAIKAAQQALGGLGSTLADVGKTAAGFVLGNILQDVGGGLSGAFEKGISEAQNFGQATLSLQRVIGGTAEQVSGMTAAMERFGLTQEDASRSLGIFSKNIEAFENGSAKADASGKGFAGAVNSLGLSLKDATGATLPMNELMLQVADKFRAMPDGVEKTADAMALFGRSGKDMILFLNQGSEGLQEAMDAAQKYGLTLSGENLEAVRQFGLAHKDLDEAMQGLTLQLGLAFMPALSALATTAVSLAQTFNTNVMPSVHALGAAIGVAVDWIRNGLIAAFTALQPVLTPIGAFLSEHLMPALAGISGAIAVALTPALVGLAATAITAGAGIVAAFLPVALPFIAIGIAVAALKAAWDADFGGIQEITTRVLGQVGDTLGGLAAGAMRDFGLAMDAVRAIWEAFTGDAGAMGVVYDVIRQVFGDSVADFLQPFLQWFMDAIPGIQNFLGQASVILENFGLVFTKVLGGDFSGAADTFMATMNALGALIGPKLAEWGRDFLDWLAPVIPQLMEQLGNLLEQLTAWLISTGVPTLEAKLAAWGSAFVAWVGPMIPPLLAELGTLLGQLGAWLTGTALPAIATALAEWGGAFVKWVAPQIPPLLGELASLNGSLINWVTTEALPLIIGSLIGWGIAFVEWVADVIPQLPGKLGEIVTTITNWVSGTATSAMTASGGDIGKALIDGIGSAISGAATALEANAARAIANTVDAMKAAAHISSPSQLTFDEVGVPLAQGIIDGIQSQQDAMTAAVTTTLGNALTRNTDLTDVIKQTAAKYGIDASTALRVAMSEGGVTPGAVGDRGTSFGPFQLHIGGGLGDSFKSLTGLDPADIQTTIQQIDFALSNAAQHGWAAWHGAARVGISDWQGIGGVITETIPTVAAAGAATAQAIADGINSKDPAVRAAAQEAARQAAIAVSEAAPVNTFIVAGQDMGDGLNLGLLRGVDKAKAAADTWGDSILTSMQTFTQGVNTEVQNTTTKLADIATAAGNAVQTALTTESTAIDAAAQRASDSIAKLVGQANITADTSSRTSALQSQISAETAAHNAIAAADEADYQHKLQLSNAVAKLATELGNATTAAQKTSLQQQYESQVANINQSFAAQQAATAHKQQLDKAAADFKATEDAKMAQLTQTLADEAMGRQIADVIKTQVATSLAAQQTYTDAVSKAQVTADAQRQILLSSYTQRINDLKTAFLDKIPPLEGPALDAFNAFMDNINSKTEALGLSVAGSMGAVTAAVQKTLGVPGGSGDVPDAISITDDAVETFADKWQVSWDDARATLLAGGAAAKEQMGNGGVIPTAARQAADSLDVVKTAAGPTLQSTLDTLKTAAQGLGEHGFAVAHDAAVDLEGQFPGLTAAVDAWIATLGKIPTSITTTVNTNFTTNGSPGGGGGGGGGAGSRNLGSTAGTPGSFTLPNIQTGGTITVQASNLGDAITRAAQQTGVSAAAQAGGGTFGSGTNPGLAIGGITTRDVTADLHANEAVIPLERLTQIMGVPVSGGGINEDRLAQKIAAALNGVNLSVSVDDVHTGLLRKQRRNGSLGWAS